MMEKQLNYINKENIIKAIKVKKDFKDYAMQRDKRLLSDREAYIKYYIDNWIPKNEPDMNISKAVSELSRFHLFVSEYTIYRILKKITNTTT
ncbi:protein of unknown function [Tenacibaculum sp. 190524A02b]|uniref:hypothetical protein n=1 Tax=Tenacibaculum vairaonense TaxID=3137860 RepID=UPI0032B1EFFF